MKSSIRLLTLAVLFLGYTQAVRPVKQPVVAYKDNNVDQSSPWTIGVYDPDKKMVSENVIFKKNTSGVGRKLYFDFEHHPSVYVYVQKLYLGGGPKGANLAALYQKANDSQNILKSELITADDAPVGSEIRITDDKITVVDSKTPKIPKEKTRKITVYAIDESAAELSALDEVAPKLSVLPLTIQAVKRGTPIEKAVLGENGYGKPVRINKFEKTYQLTIPANQDFYLIRAKNKQGPAEYGQYTEYIQGQDIQPGSELAIGAIVRIRGRKDRPNS